MRSPTAWRRRYQVVYPVREETKVGQFSGGFRGAMASSVNSSNPPSTSVSKTKTKKKHFVSQNVSVFRAGNPVVSVFMWGVNHSINELNHVPTPVMLLPDDFKANSKIKVNNHLFNKENLPSNFKFKEYCPQVFRNLRDRFGVDDMDYQMSLTRFAPYSKGESGITVLFLSSYDRRYVIKQISSEDVADMHTFLSDYHQYVVNCHGNMVLPQFLGMYRISVDSEDTYVLVMRNFFSHRLTIHRKYDLKGSLVSREASDKEKVKELPTLKDVDFLNLNQKVYIGQEDKKLFMDKLRRDVEFLARLKIMDYSLLLGIHDVQRQKDEEEGAPTTIVVSEDNRNTHSSVSPHQYGHTPEMLGAYLNKVPDFIEEHSPPDAHAIKSSESAPRKEVYFMGLIDILTQYDTKKKAAHAAKTVKHGAGAEISTVNPEQYAKRFMDFITNIFA
ncbi:phosphatidylinositol 5-phosphate 4-kinase type-2 gamma-like isoform X1 [Hypanus sabinus]|uniref:phosphatidylinositol 5-phosphate 4-kinase type-2 gamma-like isoform X1 n=1 Tax=Hypanus sabinus TaxID=79690 RepID=UPI0028C49C31|nr:phosphatidylinositol 5-phosphate 4-kinase type-2 gamma-like isoform X1 [Hypanus sabinus]